MTGESDNQELNIFDWHDAMVAVDKALLLDRDSFDAWVQDKDNQLLISQAGMTIEELFYRYWAGKLGILITLFKEEIEVKKNKSARQFVGELIIKAGFIAPDWYVKALIEADRSPSNPRGKEATDKLKIKLECAFYYAYIEHYRNANLIEKSLGDKEYLVPGLIEENWKNKKHRFKLPETTSCRNYNKEITKILDAEFFKDKTVMRLLVALLGIDIDLIRGYLRLECDDSFPF